MLTSFLTVRPVHLHNHDLLIAEEPGQSDTPRPSALNPNLFHLAEADQPAEKIPVAGLVSGKRFDT